MDAALQQNGGQQGDQQWLVRTVENRISGPFTLEQIREMIEQGELQLGDEVCNAGTYWFYLHESEEVRAQLGIDPQRLYTRQTADATQTQTDATELEQTDPEIAVAPVLEARKPPELPELENPVEELGENTAVMSNRAFRDYHHKKPASSPSPIHVMEASPPGSAASPKPATLLPRRIPVERSRLFQLFLCVLMVTAVVLIIAVIELLQQRPA